VNGTRIRHVVIMTSVIITMLMAAVITLVALNLGRGAVEHTGADSKSLDPPSEELLASSQELPASGISASAATDLARTHVPDGAIPVSVVAGKYRDVFTIPPVGDRAVATPERLVWAVTFNAEFEICPPNGSPCWSPRPGQTQVILDYMTGEFLEAASFAPA
jgi:hypothetical protein